MTGAGRLAPQAEDESSVLNGGPPDVSPSAAAPHRRAHRHRRQRSDLLEKVGADALVVAIYVFLAVVCFWDAWTKGLSTTAQPAGDIYDFMWFLTWLPHSLFHAHNPFFSDYANYPFGLNVIGSTSILLLGFLGSPITLLAGPVAAYNVLITLSLAGSATAAYFVIRRWVSWRPAAAFGGLVYGFSPFMIGEGLGHIHLAFAVFPPLILLVLHDMAVRQKGNPYLRGLLLAGLLVGQFFVAAEVVVTVAVMGLVLIVMIAIVGRRTIRDHVAYLARALATAVVVSAALLAYPVWFYLRGPQHINGPLQVVGNFRADLFGIVVPDSMQRLAPHALTSVGDRFGGNLAENGSYLGIILVAIVVIGCIALRRLAIVRVVAVFGLVAFVLSLGSRLAVDGAPSVSASGTTLGTIPLPGAIMDAIPLAKDALPVRYSMYVALAAAFLLAVILHRVHQVVARRAEREGSPRKRVVATAAPLGLGLAAIVLLIPNVPYTMANVAPPPYFRSSYVERIPAGSPAVVYPYSSPYFNDPTLWQADVYLRYRMMGGYFLVPYGPERKVAAWTPTTTGNLLTDLYLGHPATLTPALVSEVRQELSSIGVRTMVAVPIGATPTAELIPYLTSLLGSRPVYQAGAYVWYNLRL